jgi:hypothetical protein
MKAYSPDIVATSQMSMICLFLPHSRHKLVPQLIPGIASHNVNIVTQLRGAVPPSTVCKSPDAGRIAHCARSISARQGIDGAISLVHFLQAKLA